MRRRISAALVVPLLALGSCQREPTRPDPGAVPQATLAIRADLAGTGAAMVVVEVTAIDIAPPLVFNILTVSGIAAGAITLPAGSSRTITLRAFDLGGVQTHAGSVTLNIQQGTNAGVSIVLTPLTGTVPITVTLGSFSVTVSPTTASVLPGDTVRLTATILDASGHPVTGQVMWATLNSSVAIVTTAGQQTGRVTALSAGQSTVVAAYAGVAGSAVITVTPSNSIFPLHTEAGNRYLVNAQGNAFLLQGESAWSLFTQLTNEEAEQYLENRRLKGFNTVLVSLLGHGTAAHFPNNAYGDGPFLTPGDFATPNEAYFAHAASVINLAAQKGMLVLLAPAYMGFQGGSEGWYQVMVANGATKLSDYGTYVANRFRAYNNILWVEGGDYNPPILSLLHAIPNAIRAVEPKWLHTFHGGRHTAALGFFSTTEPWLTANDIYTSQTDVVESAFREYQRSSMPFFLIEAFYEGEGASEAVVRQQGYQAVLSGSTGQVMGNLPMWLFASGWQEALESPASRTLGYLPALLAGRAWWTMLPDITHTVLTSGLGELETQAVTARASDGSFVLAYLPTSRSVTVDLTQLSGPNVVARWYDPANGTYATVAESPFAASSSQVFTPPGANSSFFDDWVLVLDSSP